MIDVINNSTGRNNSTETKFHQQIFNDAFASGFALALMAKDLGAAADLAQELGIDAPALALSRDLWTDARARLADGADHTEIFRYLEERAGEGNKIVQYDVYAVQYARTMCRPAISSSIPTRTTARCRSSTMSG